ncbi:MAG TPA: 50S ribosomal protein L23 [Planctomycetaceae bacterium]|nr:50S ribosomal protein L23 [Planctomycetaceae bacterium]
MSSFFGSGVTLEPHQVIRRPLVTEKGTHLSEKLNAYSFEVHPLATKTDIKAAVQQLWDVRVVAVRTQTRVGKPRRHKAVVGHTRSWKKAVVKLHDEDRIAFF